MKLTSMSKGIHILTVAALALSLTACQDVIEIDLDEAASAYVIQGAVTNQEGTHYVYINQSVPFDQVNNYPAVNNALVVLTDGATTDTLTQVAPGQYATRSNYKGMSGRNYQLTVTIDNQEFTASSRMPQPVELADINTTISAFGGSNNILGVPIFDDPAGTRNYYRFELWENGQRWPNIFILDDRNSDGLRSTRPLQSGPNSERELNQGDTLRIVMHSITQDTYKYLYTLDASSGTGPNATTPANPDNNFGGKVLGYFSAHTVSEKIKIVE
jgi:hypothetical protein